MLQRLRLLTAALLHWQRCSPSLLLSPLCSSQRFLHSGSRARPPPLYFSEAELSEQFVRGSGSGGQAVQTTSNCVILSHLPTGLTVRCHKTRSLDLNRRAARAELQLQLDSLHRGAGR